MQKTRAILATSGAAALMITGAASASAVDGTYNIDLKELNGSGSTGTATLTLEGTALTVDIEASGLVPGAPHAQHIHGDADLDQDYVCPTAADDADGDGIVSTAEGLPKYGDIFYSLTTEGDTSPDSGLAVDRMPVADEDGNVSYSRTIEISDAAAEAVTNLHVVQHGIDVNGNGEYDNEAGPSELDPSLPQEATAPASCGIIAGSNIVDAPAGGVDTGRGDTAVSSAPMLLAGGAAVIAAGGVLLYRRRLAQD